MLAWLKHLVVVNMQICRCGVSCIICGIRYSERCSKLPVCVTQAVFKMNPNALTIGLQSSKMKKNLYKIREAAMKAQYKTG